MDVIDLFIKNRKKSLKGAIFYFCRVKYHLRACKFVINKPTMAQIVGIKKARMKEEKYVVSYIYLTEDKEIKFCTILEGDKSSETREIKKSNSSLTTGRQFFLKKEEAEKYFLEAQEKMKELRKEKNAHDIIDD